MGRLAALSSSSYAPPKRGREGVEAVDGWLSRLTKTSAGAVSHDQMMGRAHQLHNLGEPATLWSLTGRLLRWVLEELLCCKQCAPRVVCIDWKDTLFVSLVILSVPPYAACGPNRAFATFLSSGGGCADQPSTKTLMRP